MKEEIIERNNYNIHLIKTNKFRNNVIRIYFRRKIDDNDNNICNALEILEYGSKFFKNRRELNLKLEDLYNVYLNTFDSRIGSLRYYGININYINPKYFKEDLNHEVIKFLFDFLNNPLYEEKYIEDYNREINVNYNNSMKDPDYIASSHANDLYYDKYKYKKSILDKYIIEDVNNLTVDKLNEGYNLLMNDTYVDIFLAGNFTDKDIKDIKTYNKFTNNLKGNIDYKFDYEPEIVSVKESGNSMESKIIIKYYLNCDSKYNASTRIFNYILGGSSSAKLFDNLRNKNSLCYGAYSKYSNSNNMLSISTSVTDVDKSLKLIDDTVKEMKDNISNDEFNNAIKYYNNSIKDTFNSLNRIISLYFRLDYIYNISLDEYIDSYNKVTLEEVKDKYKLLNKKITYVLEGSNNNDRK